MATPHDGFGLLGLGRVAEWQVVRGSVLRAGSCVGCLGSALVQFELLGCVFIGWLRRCGSVEQRSKPKLKCDGCVGVCVGCVKCVLQVGVSFIILS